MCVTDRHDMTLAVKVALNLNTTNQKHRTSISRQHLKFHGKCGVENIAGKDKILLNSILLSIYKILFLMVVKSLDHVMGVNPLRNKLMFLGVCSTSLMKTQWEKKKYFRLFQTERVCR